ncbi:MAG: DUF4198 domain-containing protein, partial [Bdellovibrionales bacterium]|nr:DUF4198 domain-containing protein [Bdellovibrionales bacterium]
TTFRTKMLFGGDFNPEASRPLRADVTASLDLHTAGQSAVSLMNSVSTATPDGYTDIKVKQPGSYWLVSERKHTFIELGAKKFEKYLRHENLEHIIEERRRRKETNKPGKESYGRSLKTYVSLGAKKDGETWRMRIPQRIEINPKSDPSSFRKGQKATFQIYFGGRPLGGVNVNAMHSTLNGDVKVLSSQTNKAGKVTFQFDRTGFWLIRLVHMRRCEACKKADWESFWGSLTLGVKES